MLNFSILSDDKVRKIAITQATLIALFILLYFVAIVGPPASIRTPKGSMIESDTMLLAGGMETLLVLDPNAGKSSVAISVGTGSNADDIPGLAHFVEHLILVSSSKYPNADQFSTFISENGGTMNAFTEAEQTNFFFEVKHSALEVALDMFASYFIHPLFPSDRVTDEVQAVDSEHQKNFQNDQWREFRLLTLMSDQRHPFHHFATGSAETLYRENLRELALQFYQKWYKANNMKMVIISNKSIRITRMFAMHSFSFLPRGPVPMLSSPHPFPSLLKVAMSPRIAEGQTLTLFWPFPNQRGNTATQPLSFLVYLLSLQTPNTLITDLRTTNRISTANVDYLAEFSDFALVSLHLELTEEGLKDWRKCLNSIANYVASVLDLKADEMKEVWDYFVATETLKFDYQTEIRGGETASALASNMRRFPRNQYFTAYSIPQQFDYNLIHSYMKDYLQDGFLGVLMSPKFEKGMVFDGRKLTLAAKEHFYEIDYEIVQVRSRTKPEIREIPLPVHFRRINAELIHCVLCDKHARKLGDTTWFMFDQASLQPVASLSLLFRTFSTSLSSRILSELTAAQLSTVLEEEFATDFLQGCSFALSASSHGIELVLSALNSDLMRFTDAVMQKITVIRYFPLTVSRLKTTFQAADKESAFEKAQEVVERLIVAGEYLPEEMATAIDSITQEELYDFIEKMFTQNTMESLIYGNIAESDAEAIAKWVKDHNSIGTGIDPVFPTRFPISGSHVYQISSGTNNHAISNVYSLGPLSPSLLASALVLENLLSDSAYDVLRNRQQLGYLVFAFLDIRSRYISMMIAIQGHTHSPEEMDERIGEFLREYRDTVWFLDEASLGNVRNSVGEMVGKVGSTGEDRRKSVWQHVVNGDYLFGEKEDIAKEVVKVTKKDLVDLLDFLVEDSAVISVQVFSATVHPSPRHSLSDLNFFHP